MKITIIGVGMYPHEVGGAQTHAFHVAHSLAQRGHEVSALVFHRGNGALTCSGDQSDGFRRVRIGIPEQLWKSPFDRTLDDLREQLGKLSHATVAAWQPELVHFFRHSPVQPLVIDLVEKSGVPAVFTGLGFDYFCARGPLVSSPGHTCDGEVRPFRCETCMFLRGRGTDGALGPLASLALRGLDRISPPAFANHPQLRIARQTSRLWQRMLKMNLTAIAPSQVVERTFLANGFPAERMVRMTYGIPYAMLAHRKAKTVATRVRFTYLGKISQYKGALVAVQAARIAAARGAKFELRIFGPLSPDRDEYHRKLKLAIEAKPWPVGVEVRLCGRYKQEELAAIHADTDAMLFTSLWPENATIAVLESLALGTPVVASDVEGVIEFIREGENGWVYPRGDANALAGRMTALCESRDAVKRAQARTSCVLSLPQMTTELEATYRKILAASA